MPYHPVCHVRARNGILSTTRASRMPYGSPYRSTRTHIGRIRTRSLTNEEYDDAFSTRVPQKVALPSPDAQAFGQDKKRVLRSAQCQCPEAEAVGHPFFVRSRLSPGQSQRSVRMSPRRTQRHQRRCRGRSPRSDLCNALSDEQERGGRALNLADGVDAP
jgi:hypothetical protein